MTTEELIKLLQAAKAGDKQAFSAVYSTFYLPIFRYCQKRLRHLPDSEDITQQVFLRLYTSRTEFTNKNLSPLNYLYTIARNCLADFWQKQNRTPVNLPEDLDVAADLDPQEEVMSRTAAEQLLNLVSAEEKEILTLRLIDGYTSQEVALKINKSEAAVRQIQCRALKKIRLSLRSAEGGEAIPRILERSDQSGDRLLRRSAPHNDVNENYIK